jgi:outer membrane protein assembly factor BamB
MKLSQIFIILFFFSSCSFDNKTGIWEDEIDVIKKKDLSNAIFKDFKKVVQYDDIFNKEVKLKKNFNFYLKESSLIDNWPDEYLSNGNKLGNLKYNNTGEVILKGKRVSQNNSSNKLLYVKKNLIITDEKGNIIFFSIEQGKKNALFNFYKTQHKKIKKKLNLIADNEIIYVSDNLGYLYAYDFQKKKVKWAKNYKIPFQSNLKIFKNMLVAADQNNTLYFFNKDNGDKINSIPTEETLFKNNFRNNIAVNNEFLYFLNSYGSLYAIDQKLSLRWFRNFNKSLDINPANLFNGNEILIYENKAVVTTDKELYLIDAENGSTLLREKIVTSVKPVLESGYLFLLSKNFFFITIDISKGEIISSIDLRTKLEKEKFFHKKITLNNIILLNNDIYAFFDNSHYLIINIFGNLKNISKLPSSIYSYPIVINGSLFFLNQKNKLFIIN